MRKPQITLRLLSSSFNPTTLYSTSRRLQPTLWICENQILSLSQVLQKRLQNSSIKMPPAPQSCLISLPHPTSHPSHPLPNLPPPPSSNKPKSALSTASYNPYHRRNKSHSRRQLVQISTLSPPFIPLRTTNDLTPRKVWWIRRWRRVHSIFMDMTILLVLYVLFFMACGDRTRARLDWGGLDLVFFLAGDGWGWLESRGI